MKKHLGLDIGGANIKFYRSDTDAAGRHRFELWRRPRQLARELEQLFVDIDQRTSVVVTMTGELCDCFENKQQGVESIVDSVVEAFKENLVLFYQSTGEFCSPETAKQNWQSVAAANWHATASWNKQFLPTDEGLMIDMGSTTTDLIPIVAGAPATLGFDDFSRILNHELIYTGLSRTPAFGLLPMFRHDGQRLATATEYFSSMHDVYLVLDEIEEDANNLETFDGRPRTKSHAIKRLARMVCADLGQVGENFVLDLANQAAANQRDLIVTAIQRLVRRIPNCVENIVICGEGESVIQKIVALEFPKSNAVRVERAGGNSKSVAAAAVAIAKLAELVLHV